jgi:hypothetical protein
MSGHGPVNLPSREVIMRSRKQMLDENGLLIITLPSTSRSLLCSPFSSKILLSSFPTTKEEGAPKVTMGWKFSFAIFFFEGLETKKNVLE